MTGRKNKDIALDEQIISKIKDVVHKTSPDSEIFLYGSRARGTSKIHSDWDLLIIIDKKKITFDFERKMMDKLYDIEIETGEVISPLIYTKKDWIENHAITPLFENIHEQGIQIK